MIKVILLCALIVAVSAQQSSQKLSSGTGCSASALAIKRTSAGGSWKDGQGKTNQIYDLNVTSTGVCSSVTIAITISLPDNTMIISTWNLQSNGSSDIVSGYGNELAVGVSSADAGFILASSNATFPDPTIIVSIVNCYSSCLNSSSSSPTSSPSNSSSSSNSSSANTSGFEPVSETLQMSLKTAATEVQRLMLLKNGDFVFDFAKATQGVSASLGGKTVAATPDTFPAVIGHNIAMTVGFIGPCGINLPHTHPRATEINFIVSGSFLAGFFLENGAQFIGNNLTAGMATVFPQGAIHFEINMNCEPAMFVAAFNNEDPGVQTVGSSFFGLPVDIAATSLNITVKTVEDLLPLLPKNVALGTLECRQRCGL